MSCPECRRDNPEVAQYCYVCGHALRRADRSRHGRDNSYAIAPSESVHQVAVISTIMPHTSRDAADNYRWAFLITAALVLVFNLAGILPAAVVAGAFLVPVTYLMYIYDVNLWEETPVPVVGALFLFTGLLATLTSIVFFRWIFGGEFFDLGLAAGERGGGLANLPIGPLLLFAVLLPILAEIFKQIGPIFLARMPVFDDQIDALTFGVASGTAYAAFETVVAYAPVFASHQIQTTQGITSWVVVILNLMLVKSLIYGTTTGIALASFSGRGEGYDGFTPKYYASFALAAGANVAYWFGTRLLAYAPFGQALGLLWGVAILAFLIIRIRVMLQSSLLDAAVEDAAAQRRSPRATTDGGYCPNCEVPLLPDSMFCIACGMSVRATSREGRRHVREPSTTRGVA